MDKPVDYANIARNLKRAGYVDGRFGFSDREGGCFYRQLADGRYEFRDSKTGEIVATVYPKEDRAR